VYNLLFAFSFGLSAVLKKSFPKSAHIVVLDSYRPGFFYFVDTGWLEGTLTGTAGGAFSRARAMIEPALNRLRRRY
jgi:hypothetical protein